MSTGSLWYSPDLDILNIKMKVTVFYDYICPYCYLGAKRLEKLEKEFELDIEWKGIEIHPEFPSQGVRRSKSASSKIFKENISQMAKDEGVEIRLPGFVTNTRLSLEASEFSKTKGRFKDFHTKAYEAYFQNGENIGDSEVILNVAKNSGLDKRELKECLDQRKMSSKIEENKNDAEDNLILGTPTFIFGGFPVYGVQDLETMRQIIKGRIEREGISDPEGTSSRHS